MSKQADMRHFVRDGYERGDYQGTYRTTSSLSTFERPIFEQFTSLLPTHGTVLDMGCGPGVPFDRWLVDQGFRVTGIDITQKHVALARAAVPEATINQGDFLSTPAGTPFDGVLAIFAIFHVPREEHETILRHWHALLAPRGVVLLTVGVDDFPYVESDFVGSRSAWSSYSADENLRIVKRVGFTVINQWMDTSHSENHLWILARKH